MARIEKLANPRFLAGGQANISVTFSVDGNGQVPDDATLGVVDEAGTTVVAPGTSADIGTGGQVSYPLSAAENNRPRLYTATWTITYDGNEYTLTSHHESVGALLFTEREARAAGAGADQAFPLANTARYPDETIGRWRDQITDAFEDVLGFAIGGRYRRWVGDGRGSQWFELPDVEVAAVRSISERTTGTTSWEAYTGDELADVLVYPDGRLLRETLGVFTYGRRNVAVEYEVGRQPIPLELRRAALTLLLFSATDSDIPDRAVSQTNQFGNINLAVAGRGDSWFGLPEVDAVLTRLRRKRPGLG